MIRTVNKIFSIFIIITFIINISLINCQLTLKDAVEYAGHKVRTTVIYQGLDLPNGYAQEQIKELEKVNSKTSAVDLINIMISRLVFNCDNKLINIQEYLKQVYYFKANKQKDIWSCGFWSLFNAKAIDKVLSKYQEFSSEKINKISNKLTKKKRLKYLNLIKSLRPKGESGTKMLSPNEISYLSRKKLNINNLCLSKLNSETAVLNKLHVIACSYDLGVCPVFLADLPYQEDLLAEITKPEDEIYSPEVLRNLNDYQKAINLFGRIRQFLTDKIQNKQAWVMIPFLSKLNDFFNDKNIQLLNQFILLNQIDFDQLQNEILEKIINIKKSEKFKFFNNLYKNFNDNCVANILNTGVLHFVCNLSFGHWVLVSIVKLKNKQCPVIVINDSMSGSIKNDFKEIVKYLHEIFIKPYIEITSSEVDKV